MGIDFPNSLLASVGQKFTYSGQEYEFNGTAWRKVKDRVTSFNGATGAIVGVTSVQGKTGDVTLTDLEITHGVETFNGLSGSIDTTSLVLPVTGISASGGITSNGPSTINGYGFLDTGVVLAPNGLNISLEGDSDIDIKLRPGAFSINDTAESVTTVVKGDSDVHLLTVKGSSDRVGIGVQVPQEKLDVNGTIKASGITLSGGITCDGGITLSGDISIAGDIISQDDNLAIRGPGGSEILMSFLGSQTIINNSATNQDIIIKGVGDSQLFATDAGNARVGIGTLTPTEKFDVNGTIKATTGITLGAGGITFADGTFQDTAARAGLKYTVTSGTPSAGEIYLGIDISGIIDQLLIHDTDAHGNDISGILSLFADNGGYIQVLKDDGSALIGVAVDATETSVATFGSDKLTIQQVFVDFEIEEQVPSAGDTVYIDINPSLSTAVQSIGGTNTWNKGNIQLANGLTAHNLGGIGVGYLQVEESAINFLGAGEGTQVSRITFSDDTNQTTAAKTDIDVATFTISASSAITTGKKTNSLYRIPYDATLTNVDVKVSDTGGFTAGAFIAGGDFGDPTVGSLTGATLGVAGLTGSSSSFNITTVTGGNFLFFDVINNDSGSTQAQMFVSFERR